MISRGNKHSEQIKNACTSTPFVEGIWVAQEFNIFEILHLANITFEWTLISKLSSLFVNLGQMVKVYFVVD